ncbi:hypothetical protein, partial [Campylobacter sp. 2018MI13]|uniref:hypothetical protein n=1 Tax=Campylobacter sp. 2018MI13 TaxID=2836737 RepID=UPI001BDAFE4F
MKKIINNITAFLLNGKQDDVKEEKQPNDKFKDWLLEFRIKESVALDKMLMNLSIAIIAFMINYILDKDFLNKLNNYCNYYVKISFLDINWFILILIIFLSIRCYLV